MVKLLKYFQYSISIASLPPNLNILPMTLSPAELLYLLMSSFYNDLSIINRLYFIVKYNIYTIVYKCLCNNSCRYFCYNMTIQSHIRLFFVSQCNYILLVLMNPLSISIVDTAALCYKLYRLKYAPASLCFKRLILLFNINIYRYCEIDANFYRL